MALHKGKLSYPLETNVTEALSDWIVSQAHAQGVPKAQMVRDLLFLAVTGETFSFHEAKDKEIKTKELLAQLRESSGTTGGQS